MDYKPHPDKDIKKVMDYKGSQIKAAQATKNDAIKMAGAARDATLIVTTFYPELKDSLTEGNQYVKSKEDVIQEKWKYWRDWFYNQSDVPFI